MFNSYKIIENINFDKCMNRRAKEFKLFVWETAFGVEMDAKFTNSSQTGTYYD